VEVTGQGTRGAIPSGIVTFLFTDVEGSTQLWASDADRMAASLRRHDELIRTVVSEHDGYVFATAGDAFCVAFDRASTALEAAHQMQLRLDAVEWPGPALSVRMGTHLGEADERGGDYFGAAVNTAARVAAAGHGGQVLVTDLVRSAVGSDALDFGMTDLGDHSLRDVPDSVRLWQVGVGEYPPLRTTTIRSNLPTPPTRLLGRDGDVRAIRLMLAEHRLVTLVAAGGTGKTRLAIEVADAELAHWRDGVWFVDLTRAHSDDDVGPLIARAVGFEVRSADWIDELVVYLARCDVLVVLDNCEHVIDICADLVARLLNAGGRSRVLATSREWLDIDGERMFQVRSLDTDGLDSPAVKLFADRAAAVAPDFVIDDSNLAQVSELCHRLDGMPLAIELAASRVAVLSPAQLVEGLSDRFRLLSGGRRRQRHRTLEATIDWSYDLLEPDEQQVFRALGVFAGSFDIEAVASVCELTVQDATDVVEALHARSLLSRSSGAGDRFHLLETLKAYAEDRLLDAGESDHVRERHSACFTERCRVDTMVDAWRLERCIRLLPDHAELVQSADWLESNRRWDDLAEHLIGAAFVNGDDAASMIARSARCRSHLARQDLVDALLQAEVFCTMALADWNAYVAAAGALRRSPDRSTAAYGYLFLALVTARHAPNDAESLIDRFVELAGDDASGDVRDHAALWRAMVVAMSGDLDAAATLAMSVRDRPVGQSSLALNARMIVGVAAWTRGTPGELAEVAREIEALHRPTGRMDPYFEYVVGFARALSTISPDDLDSARAEVRRAALDAASGRVALVDGDALGLLAELARVEGETDVARDVIMHTGPGRSPATVAALRSIAASLGVEDELEAAYRDNLLDRDWMIDRPRAALRRELDRRGWSED